MNVAMIRDAIKAVIAGADPGSLVHDYERWTNDPAGFESLYIPEGQADGDRYIRAWLIKWQTSDRQWQTHSDAVEHQQFMLRFLHSVKDDAASEKVAATIVEAVQQAFFNHPTMGLPDVTTNPIAGSNAGQVGPVLERNEYLQIGQVLCHLCELRLIVEADV